jgi:hypothetical protein
MRNGGPQGPPFSYQSQASLSLPFALRFAMLESGLLPLIVIQVGFVCVFCLAADHVGTSV